MAVLPSLAVGSRPFLGLATRKVLGVPFTGFVLGFSLFYYVLVEGRVAGPRDLSSGPSVWRSGGPLSLPPASQGRVL